MKNVFALAGMLVASLLTSAALGAARPILDYDSSSNGFYPETGRLKNQNNCPNGTAFFKNVAPGLTNGSGPGSTMPPIEFTIDGETVTMFISWDTNNSFAFELTGGVAHIVAVTSDTNNSLYDYVNFYTAVNRTKPDIANAPVFSDGDLNKIDDAADVNHLDLCLSLVDATPPVIEFISPLDGDTVSGTVTVIVTATDPSGVDSVTVSVNDGTPVPMTCTQEAEDRYRCTYDWVTTEPGEELPAGTYTITVEAKDGAEPVQNTVTRTITVDLVNSFVHCFGVLGQEDFFGDPDPDGFANGCEPTVLANVQVPPDTDVCNPDLAPDPIPEFCYISGEQLKPDPRLNSSVQQERDEIVAELTSLYGGCDACALGYCGDITAGEYGIPDPRMICDGNFNFDPEFGTGGCEGNWIPPDELVPLIVKDVVEDDQSELVLGKYVYGYKGCFAASQHFRGGTLLELYPAWPEDPATGLVFIKTHRPANVIREAVDPEDAVVAECNLGEADAAQAQAGYLPILKNQSVDRLEDGTPAITLAATQKCVNPPRTLSRDNGIDVSNIIETDGSDDPLAFKYQMAQMQFDALYTALDCAQPTFLRGRIKFSDVSSPINQAQAQFSNGSIAALERARDDLEDAACAIREAKWDVTAENCAGDALARTENLAWRMTDLLAAQGVPYDPDRAPICATN